MQDAEADAAGAKERLFAALYNELHRLAERELRRSVGVQISPTTLLHETYLGLAAGRPVFPDRGRFMSYASRVMRGLIIDFARQRRALKRGGQFHITQIGTDVEPAANPDSDEPQMLQLSAALDELAALEPRLAEVVDLKYFCGFSNAEVGAMRGVSERTVQRDWDKARLFLLRELGAAEPT